MIDYSFVSDLSQLVSKLSIFLFIIAANYVGDIYSCGIRHLMREYIFVKHIIGFFIMLFFIGLIQEKLSIETKILQSFVLYIWFIFIMRAPTFITIITIFIICSIYIIHLYITDLKTKLEENKEINEKNSKLIEKYTNISNVLFLISFVISITGTIGYIYILRKNFGSGFSITNFLLGTRDQECFKPKVYKRFKKNSIFFDVKKAINR